MNRIARPLFDIAPEPEIIPPDAGGIIAIAAAAAAIAIAVILIVRACRKSRAASPGDSSATREEKK